MSQRNYGFYDDIIAVNRASAERRLWIKVLELAVEDVQEGNAAPVIEWLDTPEFRIVCKAAGCSPRMASSHFRELHLKTNTKEKPRGRRT